MRSFKIETPGELEIELYAEALKLEGKLLLHLGFPDPSSQTLVALATALGTPHAHNEQGLILWDVRPYPDGDGTEARSHSALPFPMHSDCSFEDPAPRFMALHVLREDRKGGGMTLLALVSRILEEMDPDLGRALETDFVFRVPREFDKGVSERSLPIRRGEMFRYRREQIDEALCTPQQREALDEFERIMSRAGHVDSLALPAGSIFVLDNWRYLHGRTRVHDSSRHLRRVRFHPPDGSSL